MIHSAHMYSIMHILVYTTHHSTKYSNKVFQVLLVWSHPSWWEEPNLSFSTQWMVPGRLGPGCQDYTILWDGEESGGAHSLIPLPKVDNTLAVCPGCIALYS